jgi:hypothetical protein
MFVSILGEELRWRGFLQDALRPLPPVKRFVLIGVMWEFWHFTTRTTRVVSAKGRGNVADFLFSRDSSQLRPRIRR